jgi:hypothetical protein
MGNEFIFSRLRKMKQDAAGVVNPMVKEPLVKLVEDLCDVIRNQERVIHHMLHAIERSCRCKDEELTNEEPEMEFSAPKANGQVVKSKAGKAKTRAPRKAKKQKANLGDV